MLKVELHAHTADDPQDYIPHTVEGLVDRLAALGYDAAAITLHDRQLDLTPHQDHAASRGVVLLPGVERAIEGRHTLLINFPAADAERVRTFDDLAALRARHDGLVVAPHPYYPVPHCLQTVIDRRPELFDAVELHALYARWLDFNRRALAWARTHAKPVVGNGDVHRLAQLGWTWSLVDAPPDPDAICAAIKAGRVEVETRPLSLVRLGTLLASVLTSGVQRWLGMRHPGETA